MGKSRRQNNRNRRRSRRQRGGGDDELPQAVEEKPSRKDRLSRRLGLKSSGTVVKTINKSDDEFEAGFQQLTSGTAKEATFKIGISEELTFDRTGTSMGMRSKILKHARKIKLKYEPLDSNDKTEIMYTVRFTDTQGTTATKEGNGEFKVREENITSSFQEDAAVRDSLEFTKVSYVKSSNENNLHVAFLKEGEEIKNIDKSYYSLFFI